jgi:superfamily I DNA/RNA helicase
MTDLPDPLLNPDGEPFEDLEAVAAVLSPLDNTARESYRNTNSAAVAQSEADRLLIVAGPGTGKSRLFMDRIKYWVSVDGGRSIYVTTFVRKLVMDLRNDIQKKLDEAHRDRVDVGTLHTLARSLVERGATVLGLRRHVRVVDRYWSRVLWQDLLEFHPGLASGFTISNAENQLHNDQRDASSDWTALWATHDELARFFNALGFAQFIVSARQAIEAAPGLVEHELWIVDEYQDFNASEDHLIRTLIGSSGGVLMAGDDDQALYQTLKASSPGIIIGHYADQSLAKAMLPFCSRCSYYVCGAASAFMQQHRASGSIDKIYLPLVVDTDARRVQVVATASPNGAIRYIEKFLEDHDAEYATYIAAREEGKETDPFLLILSPNGALSIHKNTRADEALAELVARYSDPLSTRSPEYLRTTVYATAGWFDTDNFAVRKLLEEENLSVAEVHGLIETALRDSVTLAEAARRHFPDAMDRAVAVTQVLEREDLFPHEQADAIAGIINIADREALARDVADHPIARARARQEEDEEAIETAEALPPVAFMTMVGSKGLSAHHVILLGCDEASLGRTPALTFFVAMTRARKSLHIVIAAKVAGADAHPFIYDLPEDCCSYSVFKVSGDSEPLLGPPAFAERLGTWQRMTRSRRG